MRSCVARLHEGGPQDQRREAVPNQPVEIALIVGNESLEFWAVMKAACS